MKNLIQYSFSCTNAMFNFLIDKDKDKLIADLKRVEEHAKKEINNKEASLWFKFGENDTLSTTISEIEADLSLPSKHGNYKSMIENFELVTEDLEPKKELRVFFS